MKPQIMEKAGSARDFYALTEDILSVCIPVRHDFEAGKKVVALAPQAAPAQSSSGETRAATR